MAGVVLAAAILLTGSLFAQRTETNSFGSVKRLKCTFPLYVVGSWKNGPHVQVKEAAQFSLDFDEIDADGGTAQVTGTSGVHDITVLLTPNSLHFMERSVLGALNITTVFASETGASDGKWRAVHSRHDYLPISLPDYESEPAVSQNYGACVKSEPSVR